MSTARRHAVIVPPGRHPGIAAVTRWFDFEHLPPHLAAASRPFAELAQDLVDIHPDDTELTVGLRYLLSAKDSIVRVALAAAE